MRKTQSLRHATLVALLLTSLTSVTGCQTMKTPISGTDEPTVACAAFAAISYSRDDTKETRRQIVGHNAAYDALCKRKGME